MSKESQGVISCPKCKASLMIRFKKPTFLTPAVFTRTCPSCKSDHLVRVQFVRGAQAEIEFIESKDYEEPATEEEQHG